jgi:hypothetical protein
MTDYEKQLLLECISQVTLSCNDRCVGKCDCNEMVDEAIALIEKLDKL